MAVEEFREAGRLLVGTIYLLAKEGSDLHCARKCAHDFIEDDSKWQRRTANLDLPAAKNGVEEGMQKCDEVGATIKAVHGAVASFDETGRET
ncbi:hypothetical protein ERJ75_001218600 [Trypanosoma vivax]|nr:hypothetical protein ERJ75_001218600 [Trypanosoma vivax]